MIKTKRILFGLIAVSVMLCLLTACGSGQSSNGTTNGTNSVPNYYESQTDDYDFQESDVDPVQALLSESLMYPSQNSEWKYDVYKTYVKITGYLGEQEQDIIVPETIENLPVKAFNANMGTVTSIKFPSTLVILGDRDGSPLFFDINNVFKSVTLPEGLIEIGESVFESCDGLTEIKFPSTLKKIGPSAFENCFGLQSLTIPVSVEKIGPGAFFCNGERALNDVTILNPNADIELSNIHCKIMYGHTGSTAAKFASKNGIPFKVIE